MYPEDTWLFLTSHLHECPSEALLRIDMIATLVIESMLRGQELGQYQLGPFVLLPSISPSLLLKSLKGATAREANRLLGRAGEPFWQRETYDHWVRSEREWSRIAAYIEHNPVKAGPVLRTEDYPWSSANPRWIARRSACATATTRIPA